MRKKAYRKSKRLRHTALCFVALKLYIMDGYDSILI